MRIFYFYRMKKIGFLFLASLFLFSCQFLQNEYVKSIETERYKKDSLFLQESESPLSFDQIKEFKGLKYFPINEKFKVKARLVQFDSGEVIKLKTSTDRLPDYKRYGYVYFKIDDKELKLTAFQNMAHQSDSLYKNLLFLPFTDNNSTILTYGGGRYIDFEIPEGETFILDFNKAYNPYCAYNHKWSCVIPPRENSLNIAIDAGEKNYKNPF